MNRSAHKTEGVNRTKTVRFYPFVFTGKEHEEETNYGYCNEYQPHAVKRMFDHENGLLYDMRWDEAGNLGQVSMGKPGEMFERGRFLFWTEDNRMHAAVDDKYFSYYVYDHSGERRLKLTGINKQQDVNADLMATYTELNEPTLYPSAYMVLSNKGYTKHYYAGTERVAARLGGGGLDALQPVIASDDELQWKADKLFKQSLDQVNHRVLDENKLECIMNNEFARDEFGKRIDGIPYQVRSDVKVDNWQFKEMVNSMLDDPNHGKEKEVYFYHSDHLGSASWITDCGGVAVQHIQYLPYGEPYINQRPFGYSERFTFTGKERDEETGYGYFGARYMDHELMTMWLSVDPMADKYPSISPYAYCAWNPVKLVDPDGREIHIVGDKEYRAQVYSLLNKLAKSGLAGKYLVYHALKDKKRTFAFIQPGKKKNHENNTVYVSGRNGEKSAVIFDANESGVFSAANGGVAKNALTSMAHELAHFVFPQDGCLLTEKGESSNIRAGEPIAVQWENRVRKDLGMDMRKKYEGRNVYNKVISESSKYRGWYNLSNTSGYLNSPTDVGSFKMKDMGNVSPYFYKGSGSGIYINGNWKEARYSL